VLSVPLGVVISESGCQNLAVGSQVAPILSWWNIPIRKERPGLPGILVRCVGEVRQRRAHPMAKQGHHQLHLVVRDSGSLRRGRRRLTDRLKSPTEEEEKRGQNRGTHGWDG